MTGYYVEDLDSLPVDLVASAMGGEVPRSVAIIYTLWHRFRARIGWRANATGATRSVTELTWRTGPAPGRALRLWGPWLEQLDDLGFDQIGWIESPTLGDRREANLWFRSPDNTIFAQLNWTLISSVEAGAVSLQSFLPDDRELQTISVRRRWQRTFLEHIKPPYVDLVLVRTDSVQRLIQSHKERFARAEPQPLSLSEFKQRLPKQLERFFHHAIKQGCLRELSRSEVRRLIDERN